MTRCNSDNFHSEQNLRDQYKPAALLRHYKAGPWTTEEALKLNHFMFTDCAEQGPVHPMPDDERTLDFEATGNDLRYSKDIEGGPSNYEEYEPPMSPERRSSPSRKRPNSTSTNSSSKRASVRNTSSTHSACM